MPKKMPKVDREFPWGTTHLVMGNDQMEIHSFEMKPGSKSQINRRIKSTVVYILDEGEMQVFMGQHGAMRAFFFKLQAGHAPLKVSPTRGHILQSEEGCKGYMWILVKKDFRVLDPKDWDTEEELKPILS